MKKTDEENFCRSSFSNNASKSDRDELITARIPQGYNTKINVRLVPVRGMEIRPITKGCQPRQGASRRKAEPLDLPPDLVVKLKNADKFFIAWLAQDDANAQLFMHRPAEALVKAGVDLTRAEQKVIARTHHEVSQATVIGPGVKVASFTATAFPRGHIGKINPEAKAKDKQNDKKGCAKEV